jgi:hypothetical protein
VITSIITAAVTIAATAPIIVASATAEEYKGNQAPHRQASFRKV